MDALLHYPDGRTAALEVTSAAAPGRRQLFSLVGSKYRTMRLPGEWYWAVTVDDPKDLPALEERATRLILKCESLGEAHPEDIMWNRRDDPDFAWLERSSVTLSGYPSISRVAEDGRELPAYVTQGAPAAFVDEELTGLNAAVASILELPAVRRRLTKLNSSGHAERHLYIWADMSALPVSVALALVASDANVPSEPLRLPAGLTMLWLLVSAGRVLVATQDGWVSHPRPQPE